MAYYQVSGWYPNIKPENRSVYNISNGARFSTRELAEKYVKETGMTATIERKEGEVSDVDYHVNRVHPLINDILDGFKTT